MGIETMRVEAIPAILLVLAGFGLVAVYLVSRRKALASERWPTAQATIVSSVILARRNSKGRVLYEPSVTFRYEVGGKLQTGTRISWGGAVASSSRSFADNVTGRFPQGAVVPVRYDPDNPADSVLDPGGRAGLVLIGLGGLAFAGAGGLILWLSRSG
jgi:hypothetical protein